MAKLLLVEDDNNLREIYEARLQAEGYEIAAAEDGEQALVVAKQFRPDLVISDVMMPKISGFEMLDILRNTPGLEHTRVIMLTALGQAEDKERADSLQADRYLVKSQVTLEDIVKAAHELLDTEVAPDTTAAATDLTATTTPETPTEPVSEAPASAPDTTATTPLVPTEEASQPAEATPPEVTEPIEVAEPPAEATTDADSATTADTTTKETSPTVTPATGAPLVTPTDDAVTANTADSTTDTDTTPTVSPTDDGTASSADTPTPVEETATATPVEAVTSPAPAAASGDTPAVPPGSAAAEQQTVNQQIESFIASAPETPPEVEPQPTPEDASTETTPSENATSDDKLLADAVESLSPGSNDVTTSTETPASPTAPTDTVIEPTTAPVAEKAELTAHEQVQQAENDGVTIAHKKVILPPTGDPKPNLDELLAKEEAHEQSTTPGVVAPPVVNGTPVAEEPAIQPHPTGSVISPSPNAPEEPPEEHEELDPNSIAL